MLLPPVNQPDKWLICSNTPLSATPKLNKDIDRVVVVASALAAEEGSAGEREEETNVGSKEKVLRTFLHASVIKPNPCIL